MLKLISLKCGLLVFSSFFCLIEWNLPFFNIWVIDVLNARINDKKKNNNILVLGESSLNEVDVPNLAVAVVVFAVFIFRAVWHFSLSLSTLYIVDQPSQNPQSTVHLQSCSLPRHLVGLSHHWCNHNWPWSHFKVNIVAAIAKPLLFCVWKLHFVCVSWPIESAQNKVWTLNAQIMTPSLLIWEPSCTTWPV